MFHDQMPVVSRSSRLPRGSKNAVLLETEGSSSGSRAPAAMSCIPSPVTAALVPVNEPTPEADGSSGGGPGELVQSKEGANREAERKKAERIEQNKQSLERKAARAREYEKRWRERCAKDMSEDTWSSGWKQPVGEEEFGGWGNLVTSSSISGGVSPDSNWKLELSSEQEDTDCGGWDQQFSSSSEAAPLGGWLYDQSDPFGDYATEVTILGKKRNNSQVIGALSRGFHLSAHDDGMVTGKVMVTVATKGTTVERWLEGRKEEAKWGLDIEWRPTFQRGDYHYAALLQLSLEDCCLLIQLQFIDVFPASLKSLLANPTIMMGGVGIMADTSKLRNDYDLTCAGQVELTTLAVSKLKNSSLKKSGIATLTEKVLGVSYKKNKRATMSNWENRDLTHSQIQYAAADAWLSYSILITLLNYKEKPAASSALKSEGTSGNSGPDEGVGQPSCS